MIKKILYSLFQKKTDDLSLKWPELSNINSISGRAATQEEVRTGLAAFAIGAAGNSELKGRPLNIDVPQYAYYIDANKQKQPCIVVQAEERWDGKGQTVGCRLVKDNSILVAELAEFELVGKVKPH